MDVPGNRPSDEDAVPRPVLVSACLLGRTCRYDGRHNADATLRTELDSRGEVAVPYCPEEAGGLATPRPAAWLTGPAAAVVDGAARVVTDAGDDVTDAFLAGARGALDRAREVGAERAYLKERSPSCGCESTHVDGALEAGPGVTAEVLRRAGIAVEGVEGRRNT